MTKSGERVAWIVGGVAAVAAVVTGAVLLTKKPAAQQQPPPNPNPNPNPNPPNPPNPPSNISLTPGHRYSLTSSNPLLLTAISQGVPAVTQFLSTLLVASVVSAKNNGDGTATVIFDYTGSPYSGPSPLNGASDVFTDMGPSPVMNPPIGTTWVPASSIDAGKTYRVSVPGDPTNTQLIQTALAAVQIGNVYAPNSSGNPPSDWPSLDTDPSRWRAQFVNTTGLSVPVPPIPTLLLFVAT